MGNQNERTYRRAPAKLQPPAGAQRGSIAWHPAGMAQHSTAQHSSVLHPGRKHILTVSFRDVNQHISNGCSTFFSPKEGLNPVFSSISPNPLGIRRSENKPSFIFGVVLESEMVRDELFLPFQPYLIYDKAKMSLN